MGSENKNGKVPLISKIAYGFGDVGCNFSWMFVSNFLMIFYTEMCIRDRIQSIMGHANIETTMDIYAEVTDTKKQEAIQNLAHNLDVF